MKLFISLMALVFLMSSALVPGAMADSDKKHKYEKHDSKSKDDRSKDDKSRDSKSHDSKDDKSKYKKSKDSRSNNASDRGVEMRNKHSNRAEAQQRNGNVNRDVVLDRINQAPDPAKKPGGFFDWVFGN